MKVLCIGDSLALPGHGNLCEDTWFAKLQAFYQESLFFSFFRRGITTNTLFSEGGGDDVFPHGADCLEFYLPDIVIIQLGIVDCVPRLLKKDSLISKILSRTPSRVRKFLIFLLKKVKKRSPDNAYVSEHQFYNNLYYYAQRCIGAKLKKLIFIKICSPDNDFIMKNPKVMESVNRYNKIFDDIAKQFDFVVTIDPLKLSDENIFEDGYHPNPKGNEIVFQDLKGALLID